MPLTKTTTTNILPVTPEEAMKYAVVEEKDDYPLVKRFMKAVTLRGQEITGRQFVVETFELDEEMFPTGKLKLMPNLQSVDSVKYTDSEDEEQTLDSSEYKVKKTGLIGYIKPVDVWPVDATDILVTFTAGYPTSGEDPNIVPTTPDDIVLWIMTKVSGFCEQREDFVLSKGGRFGISTMPVDFIDSYLDSYIVPGYGSGVT